MDGFTKVKKRSRRRAEVHKYDEESPIFVQRAEKKLEVAKDVIDKSLQLVTFVETISQGLSHLPDQRISEIVCYGLGNFTRSPNSMYQYALALILSDYYDCRLHLYDPVFTDTEKLIMNKSSNVISENEVGRRKADETTLFFLPHCPLELFENIVFTNWSDRLSKCVIVGNNLQNVMDSRPDRVIKEKQPCLFHVFNYAEIFEVDNIFEYNDVFNDLAVHVFPEEKVTLLPLKSDFLV